MRRHQDSLTLDLFEMPVARAPLPGALNVGLAVRHLLSDLLKDSPRNRFEITARMSELTGHEITKHQLDAWTAESREQWRFPLEYLPALEVACETHKITSWLADLRGCKVLVGKEAFDAEIGKLERLKEDAGRKIKRLKQAMGEME
ncbi:MAG: hypothetical protein LBE81_04625 [Azonexus sp.]|jgi:hypothetical protein|uniref:hypothetical protein n=1 Tax=Azonexus sp. TaxID=1872668 RepID=UPI002835F35E|nr:hypothetical protein [Azonexus sp.]MDR0775904.1 hypothetical protein [Azonexus sp.]